jgi:F-type H+-transporting ATPase subunit a
VKSFNFFLVGAFFVAVTAANINAQPLSQPVTNRSAQNAVAVAPAASAQAEAETGKPLVPEIAQTLFKIGPLPVTNSMVCTWIVAAIIFVIVRFSTWNMKEVPSGAQNVMEMLIEGWEDLVGNILEPRVARWVFPFATTFFIFIVMSNLVDLIPGVGSIGFGTPKPNSSLPFAIDHVDRPFFRPPTTDANLTVVMAGFFLVMSLYWAVRYNGVWGLVKHVFGVKMKVSKWVYPLFFLLFLFIGATELLSITFARPVALAMRLYGNIFAGESILDMVFHGKSMVEAIGLSIFVYFYETFVCVVQAFVFAMLVVAFVGTLCTHSDEEHSH